MEKKLREVPTDPPGPIRVKPKNHSNEHPCSEFTGGPLSPLLLGIYTDQSDSSSKRFYQGFYRQSFNLQLKLIYIIFMGLSNSAEETGEQKMKLFLGGPIIVLLYFGN